MGAVALHFIALFVFFMDHDRVAQYISRASSSWGRGGGGHGERCQSDIVHPSIKREAGLCGIDSNSKELRNSFSFHSSSARRRDDLDLECTHCVREGINL
jgi:hypothetical protein